ncbi:hypothetical protein, partial [Stenotrophomonas maltophilia]|uniref:hypothetical protein n=1 Tax=Stenotrophomonas maltophilia TaxID=40324 RepID=UPI00195421A9
RIGRFIKANRIGYANLKAAFPEKYEAEIQAILRGVWDNLGRTACEYACMDDLWDFDAARPNQGRVVTDDVPLY